MSNEKLRPTIVTLKVPAQYALHVGGLPGFVEAINAKIEDGWKPLGGPCVGTDGRLVQAMTKGL